MAATQSQDMVGKSLMIHMKEEKLAKIWEVWLFFEFKGDWAMFKDVFCFPGWREISGICWKCLATPSTLREFGKEAAWRQAPLTHWDVMSRICKKGNPINGIFSAPGFTKDCCYMDWLHAVDHGAQVI